MIYLLALPVWNFILPLYAFWHFDDFSWGETRKVDGESKSEAHGGGGPKLSAPAVTMRRWEDWERSRLRKLKREERRRKEFERMHPSGYLSADDMRSQYDGSDTFSLASSDDDQWGAQIGGYNEHNAQYPLPPVGLLLPQQDALHSAQTLDGAELEAMLEQGFDDRPASAGTPTYNRFQLTDSTTDVNVGGNGYTPLSQATSPGPNRTHQPLPLISPTSPPRSREDGWPPRAGPGGGRGPQEHAKEGRYGPLGPLDPAARF